MLLKINKRQYNTKALDNFIEIEKVKAELSANYNLSKFIESYIKLKKIGFNCQQLLENDESKLLEIKRCLKSVVIERFDKDNLGDKEKHKTIDHKFTERIKVEI